uniref:Uncharacterized protein n=1 Tax=Salmo trutta TaxID=8032 RepID=A0A673WWY9_SALTR
MERECKKGGREKVREEEGSGGQGGVFNLCINPGITASSLWGPPFSPPLRLPSTDGTERQLPSTDGTERQLPSTDGTERQLPSTDGTERQLPSTDGTERYPLHNLSTQNRAHWPDHQQSVMRDYRLHGNSPYLTVQVPYAPGEVLMLRLRLKSSFRVVRMAAISSFTSSRLMMSSTSEELMFTLEAWPFAALAERKKLKQAVFRKTSKGEKQKERMEGRGRPACW